MVSIALPKDERKYIQKQVNAGWTPDTIIGRNEHHISCSTRTLYRMFKRGELDVRQLPMKGRRHPNGYVETRGRGRTGQLGRNIDERYNDYPNYRNEFGHPEADTVQGSKHHGAVMTLVERLSKVEIILNIHHRTAECVNTHFDQPNVLTLTLINGLPKYHGTSSSPSHLIMVKSLPNGVRSLISMILVPTLQKLVLPISGG